MTEPTTYKRIFDHLLTQAAMSIRMASDPAEELAALLAAHRDVAEILASLYASVPLPDTNIQSLAWERALNRRAAMPWGRK